MFSMFLASRYLQSYLVFVCVNLTHLLFSVCCGVVFVQQYIFLFLCVHDIRCLCVKF